ncbi:MAG: preprotein translocase subunit SecG [Chromatiales bacterium 21-64-14]|nr:MAG: preprotein translocase subunit SecG [Chromatiales bacterium 21-64-14]HQU15435.1 preprotein translocase subunit SecG [Gammaproteobacteria bacterium]
MHAILLVIHILLVCAMVGLIMLQHGKGADAGAAFGAGASGTVFGARGSSSFLSRTTAILATLFFITSLALAYLSGQQIAPKSVAEQNLPAPVLPQPEKPAGAQSSGGAPSDLPSAPASTVPAQGSGKPGDLPAVPKTPQ